MKEKLTCLQCKDIMCADLEKGKRVISNLKEERAITFPENVKDCKRRMNDETWWKLYGVVDTRNLGS